LVLMPQTPSLGWTRISLPLRRSTDPPVHLQCTLFSHRRKGADPSQPCGGLSQPPEPVDLARPARGLLVQEAPVGPQPEEPIELRPGLVGLPPAPAFQELAELVEPCADQVGVVDDLGVEGL